MAYDDFIEEFARVQGVGTREQLLTQHADVYSFQINSRQRAKKLIGTLRDQIGVDLRGRKVLDVGCAYGSFSIEFTHAGAQVVGIDVSDKWLKLAEANARGEVDVPFIKADASSRAGRRMLEQHGPFDCFIVNDVFEHIYDTVGVVENLARLAADDAFIYYKIPNGHATRNVLKEGHKKVFAISLLAPDYWQAFVKAPFSIYYRRWQHFVSIFGAFGFDKFTSLNPVTDRDHDATRRFILSDVNRIRREVVRENFKDAAGYQMVRNATRLYFEEVEADLEEMPWEELFFKYRVTFWEGTVSRST